MLTIGLTGGYATGKTVVAKMFKKLGTEVLYADKIAHKVMRPRTDIWKKIVKCFGKDILHTNNKINRKKLGTIVFSDKTMLKKLNGFIHPAVKREIKCAIRARKNLKKVLVLEIPLLFESGIGAWFDKIITVSCDKNTQYKLARRRDKASYLDFRLKVENQMPLSEKRRKSDFVINNSGSLADTRKQVEGIWTMLVK